jgi:hypothetical protein
MGDICPYNLLEIFKGTANDVLITVRFGQRLPLLLRGCLPAAFAGGLKLDTKGMKPAGRVK